MLNALSLARAHLGSLDAVMRVVRSTASLATQRTISLHAKVADAASELLVNLFGPEKMPTRMVYGVFLNSTSSDRWTSTLDNQSALGLIYVGPTSSREHDVIGIALGRTHVNPHVARNLSPARGSEWVGEIFYGVAIDRWLELRPHSIRLSARRHFQSHRRCAAADPWRTCRATPDSSVSQQGSRANGAVTIQGVRHEQFNVGRN